MRVTQMIDTSCQAQPAHLSESPRALVVPIYICRALTHTSLSQGFDLVLVIHKSHRFGITNIDGD